MDSEDQTVLRTKTLLLDHLTDIAVHRTELSNPLTSNLYTATFLILLDNLGMGRDKQTKELEGGEEGR